MKKNTFDWRLAGGFVALLFLIVAIGLIGILQIQSLGKAVDALGRRYFPMQKAALEMRVSNSLYAMSIRNYIFWKSAKYLEAARGATNKEAIESAVSAFDRQLTTYSSFAKAVYSDMKNSSFAEQEKWVAQISSLQEELRAIGERIITLVDEMDQADLSKRSELEDNVNKLLMVFESKLYVIDRFIDGNIQKANLEAVRVQLYETDDARKKALTSLMWSLVLALAVGGETALIVYRNRRKERQRREELVREMIRIEEEERKHLSLQVHDQMGQDLSGLRIFLDVINNNTPDASSEVRESIEEGKKVLKGLVQKSHNIAELLRPPALEELGLVETVESLIFQIKNMSKIHIIFLKPQEEIALPGEYSLLLYRVAQEGLTNIINHAQAKNVEVILEAKEKTVQLAISDDGVGFAYEDVSELPHRRREDRLKLGLLGLRERVEILGGFMEISTQPGKGTRLFVQLPAKRA